MKKNKNSNLVNSFDSEAGPNIKISSWREDKYFGVSSRKANNKHKTVSDLSRTHWKSNRISNLRGTV